MIRETYVLPRANISDTQPFSLVINVGRGIGEYARSVYLKVWTYRFTAPPNLGYGQIPNKTLNIEVDGETIATELGDGTEGKLVYDSTVNQLRSPGKHEIKFSLTSGTGAVVAIVMVVY